MRRQKLTYECAANGREAVEIYRATPGMFFLILMDMSMPIMDGFTATVKIRKMESKLRIPKCFIAALTGVTSEDARDRAFDCGVDEFFSKPVHMNEVKMLVEKAIAGAGPYRTEKINWTPLPIIYAGHKTPDFAGITDQCCGQALTLTAWMLEHTITSLEPIENVEDSLVDRLHRFSKGSGEEIHTATGVVDQISRDSVSPRILSLTASLSNARLYVMSIHIVTHHFLSPGLVLVYTGGSVENRVFDGLHRVLMDDEGAQDSNIH
nr:hybrid signal transduction histidine kinase k [Quercus suber]